MINNEENKKVKVKKNTLQNVSMLIGSTFLGVALLVLFVTTIMSGTVYTITYHDEYNQVNENITSLTSEDEVKLIDLEEQKDNNGYGFRFVGWSTDEEFTNIIDTLKNVSSDMDLYASYEKYSIGLSYTSTGDMVNGLGTVTHKDIIIPSELNGNNIIGIEENAFLESDITSVYIPDSIVKINDFAFSTCTSLVDIRFPDKLTTVGVGVFAYCVSLASIELPENITTVGMAMFYGCTSLTSATIPASVTNLQAAVFGECSQLETVNLPDGLLSIGEGAFVECTSLVSIVLPNSVTNIDTHLFVDCTALTTVVLPENLTKLSNYFFQDCTSLQNVIIPDSVTYIGKQVFSGCTSLENIVIPDSVTTIDNGAFSNCTSLESIIIPDSVTSINDVFIGCTALTSVRMSSNISYIGSYIFFLCSNVTVYFDLTEEEVNSQIEFGDEWDVNVLEIVYKEA